MFFTLLAKDCCLFPLVFLTLCHGRFGDQAQLSLRWIMFALSLMEYTCVSPSQGVNGSKYVSTSLGTLLSLTARNLGVKRHSQGASSQM